MSMIKSSTTTKLKIPITLLYSCQSQNDVPFYEELIELEKQNSNFKVAFFITDGYTDKLTKGRVFKGRINEEILNQVTENRYNSFTHFICGPIKFISAMQAILIRNKVSPEHLITEVNGKRFEILVHAPKAIVKRHRVKAGMSGGSSGAGLASPMQGTVVKIAVSEGDVVEIGDLIIVLEAMKMEQPLMAHKAGVITNLTAAVGTTVSSGTVLCDIINA